VVVPPDAFDLWLDCANVNEKTASELIMPAPEGTMEAHEISSAVDRVANDSPELIVPLSKEDAAAAAAEPPKRATRANPKEDSRQGSLF
jgi:hypothetical protein